VFRQEIGIGSIWALDVPRLFLGDPAMLMSPKILSESPKARSSVAARRNALDELIRLLSSLKLDIQHPIRTAANIP
jgi:hypothetical protein